LVVVLVVVVVVLAVVAVVAVVVVAVDAWALLQNDRLNLADRVVVVCVVILAAVSFGQSYKTFYGRNLRIFVIS
jgi:hypothetical protein